MEAVPRHLPQLGLRHLRRQEAITESGRMKVHRQLSSNVGRLTVWMGGNHQEKVTDYQAHPMIRDVGLLLRDHTTMEGHPHQVSIPEDHRHHM